MTFGERAVELAGIASALLGWRPAEFWAATPLELATALAIEGTAVEQIDRDSLERLLEQFPDKRET